MEQFFTAIKSQSSAFSLGFIIISNILLFMGGIFPVYWYRKHPGEKRLHKILALLQLTEYLTIFIWYYVVGYLDFPLPLYHCRLAKLILIILAFTGIEGRFRSFYAYAVPLAIFGGVAAFLVPDVDPFPWPHITYIGYFLGHFLLLMQGTAALTRDKGKLTKADLLRGQKILLSVNLVIMAIARLSGLNYSYMLKSPILKNFTEALPPVVYTLLVFLIYALLYFVSFYIACFLQYLVRRAQKPAGERR